MGFKSVNYERQNQFKLTIHQTPFFIPLRFSMKFLSFSFSFNFDPMIYIHLYAYEGSAESKMTKTAADRHKFVMHAISDVVSWM